MEPMITDLALILICAGAMTLIFKWLKQPLVLGYIVAGFLASPNMSYMPSVSDLDNIHLWSDIGVIFLLFALGLEFSIKKILKMGSAPIIAASAIILFMMIIGYTTGQSFGWGRMDCIFLGGMLAMSSTTIIFKAFDDMGLRQQHFAGLVLSVLIIEDILAIVMMVMLSTLAVSQQVEGMQMVFSIAKLIFFLVLWFVVGIYMIPLFLRKTKSLLGDETMLVVALALCFGMVVVASSVGFSSAFGAFIMGSILAETVEAERIEHLVTPVKNLFGAIFFVSVGMMVDIQLIIQYAVPILCIIAAIMVGQTVFGSLSFLLSGQPLKTAIQCGFSLTQIGEFAFILATLGTSLGVTSDYLYPIVVAVSVFTTFTTPYMIRLAVPAYNVLERHLPARLKQILNNYANSSASASGGNTSHWRTYLMNVGQTLLIYGVLSVASIVIMFRFIQPLLANILPQSWVGWITAIVTILAIAPFLRTLMVKHNRSTEFQTLWHSSNFSRAPLVAVQLLRILIVAAIVGHVLGRTLTWNGVLLIGVVVFIIFNILQTRSLGRRTGRLEATFSKNLMQREHSARPAYAGHLVEHDLHLTDFTIPVGNAWAGHTLSELSLGHNYGVHVASILRGTERLNIPSGSTRILPGDKLQVIGTDNQLSMFGHALETNSQQPSTSTQSEMQLMRITLDAGSPFIGKNIHESGIRQRYRCLVAGIESAGDNTLLTADPKRPLCAGNVLWVVGEESDLASLERDSHNTTTAEDVSA